MRFMKLPELEDLTGLSWSALWRLDRAGSRRISLGGMDSLNEDVWLSDRRRVHETIRTVGANQIAGDLR